MFWSKTLSNKHECIRYDPFKNDIFSVGLSVLFLIHSDFRDPFDIKGFNYYTVDVTDRRLIKRRMLKLFNLGTRRYKIDCMSYISRLQKKKNQKIK